MLNHLVVIYYRIFTYLFTTMIIILICPLWGICFLKAAVTLLHLIHQQITLWFGWSQSEQHNWPLCLVNWRCCMAEQWFNHKTQGKRSQSQYLGKLTGSGYEDCFQKCGNVLPNHFEVSINGCENAKQIVISATAVGKKQRLTASNRQFDHVAGWTRTTSSRSKPMWSPRSSSRD